MKKRKHYQGPKNHIFYFESLITQHLFSEHPSVYDAAKGTLSKGEIYDEGENLRESSENCVQERTVSPIDFENPPPQQTKPDLGVESEPEIEFQDDDGK